MHVRIIIGSSVVSSDPSYSDLQPCDHEEADSRIVLHVYDAIKSGSRNILVRTVDTDVIVILVDLFSNFDPACNIWVAFGTGKFFRYYHVNKVWQALGSERAEAMPFFHSLTGCDTTSQFRGKGKKSAWDAWSSYQEATAAFRSVIEQPFQLLTRESIHFKILEWYTSVLYDRSTTSHSVNELRQELFAKKSKSIENIPPTQVCSLTIIDS